MTAEEYLRLEEHASRKYELMDGWLRAMSGGRPRHARLAGQLIFLLLSAAQDGACRVYTSDAVLRLSSRTFYHPDAMVVCDPSDDGEAKGFLTRPCLVIEVLSPSTRRIDRGEKRVAYQSLPSLETYLIVDPDRPRLEVHRRTPEGWVQTVLTDEGEITLSCPRVTLTLEAIYRNIPLS